jgi:ABC-type branched-subunit amino acid transport system permease subunit
VRRVLVPFLLAPLAAPVCYWAWNLAAGLLESPERRHAVLQSPLREPLVILAFGAPIAYAAAAVALLLGWPLLRLRGPRLPAATALAGTVSGVVTAVLLKPHLGSDPFRVILTPLQGAVMGAASAALFGLMWTRARGRLR